MPILMLFCSSCGALLRSFRGTRSRMSPVGLSTPKRTDAAAHVVVPITRSGSSTSGPTGAVTSCTA